MSNRVLKVKTFRQGSGWGFRVLDGVGGALATRTGFASDSIARQAGWAAAEALAPVAVAIRMTQDLPPKPRPRPQTRTVKPNIWRSIFG